MPLPLNQSIRQINHSLWRMGSLDCERIENTPSTDALAAWYETGCTYVLQPTRDGGIGHSRFMEPSDEVKFVHEGGSSSAVWAIGSQAFCKVKAWNSAMESEHATIAFIKKIAPQIPTPEVIYSWIDRNRSFLILRRIKGSTLRDAWTSLSSPQRDSVVETVATYCHSLAQNTSQMLGSITGKPVLEPYLAPSGSDLLGSFTHEECARYFSAASAGSPPLGRVFHFYHPDLGPRNILISHGVVAGVIDWEAAGYYPRFWVATKPSISPGLDFYPPIVEFEDSEWRKRLQTELEKLNYPQASTWYMKWRTFR